VGAPTKRYEISFYPKEGSIKKKTLQKVQIKVLARSTIMINHVISVELENGPRYFLVIKAQSEKSVFGVQLSDLDIIEDFDLKVPSVLVTMRNYLYDNDAIRVPAIFRLPGDEFEGLLVKEQLNRGTFCGCKDIHCIANLIKVWYRELPQQVLNVVSIETFSKVEDEKDAVVVFENMIQPNKSLLQWLLELVADVAIHEQTNKMNAKSLAVVLAPNLYSNPMDIDPNEGLMISQKVVNLVNHLIIHFTKILLAARENQS